MWVLALPPGSPPISAWSNGRFPGGSWPDAWTPSTGPFRTWRSSSSTSSSLRMSETLHLISKAELSCAVEEPHLGHLIFAISFFQSLPRAEDHRWGSYGWNGKTLFATTVWYSVRRTNPPVYLPVTILNKIFRYLDSFTKVGQQLTPKLAESNRLFSDREPWPQSQRCLCPSRQHHTWLQ